MSDLLRGILIGVAIGGAVSLATLFTSIHAIIETNERWSFLLMAINGQWADISEDFKKGRFGDGD